MCACVCVYARLRAWRQVVPSARAPVPQEVHRGHRHLVWDTLTLSPSLMPLNPRARPSAPLSAPRVPQFSSSLALRPVSTLFSCYLSPTHTAPSRMPPPLHRQPSTARLSCRVCQASFEPADTSSSPFQVSGLYLCGNSRPQGLLARYASVIRGDEAGGEGEAGEKGERENGWKQ